MLLLPYAGRDDSTCDITNDQLRLERTTIARHTGRSCGSTPNLSYFAKTISFDPLVLRCVQIMSKLASDEYYLGRAGLLRSWIINSHFSLAMPHVAFPT